jgi:uncharacterized protein (TIGR03083 family)
VTRLSLTEVGYHEQGAVMDHDEARAVAQVEYDRLLEVLDRLDDRAWAQPTDCAGWDVKAIAGHLLGMMEMLADAEEAQRQQKAAHEAAARTGGYRIDALTELQVREHADLSADEVRSKMRSSVAGALAARFDAPAELREVPYDPGPPFEGTWTLGYLWETILTRDPWMHRVDICGSTGAPLVLSADHDGRIVADVVDEWGARHGRAFHLELSGPAGGVFQRGDGGPAIQLDAVEFCRILSGRGTGEDLLAHTVPF